MRIRITKNTKQETFKRIRETEAYLERKHNTQPYLPT
jgi:hypothetical protein